MVAQLVDVEFIAANAGPQRGDQRADLLAAQHTVKPRAFHVQDLTPQRQNRLIAPRATLFGRPTGRVTLDEEEFGFPGVFFLTIGQFPGQACDIHRGFAAGQLAGFARGLTGQSGLNDLADDLARLVRVFLKPFGQLFVDQHLNRGADLGTDQLVFGLAAELGVGHLDRQDTGQTLTRVIAGKADLFLFRDAAGLGIVVDRPCQRAAQTRKVGAAVTLGDVVGKGQDVFVIAIVPPHGDFDANAVLFAFDEHGIGHHRVFRPVQIAHEFTHAALIEQFRAQGFRRALILDDDPHARVQERQFPQTVFQRLERVIQIAERLVRGHEPHLGAGFAVCVADLAQVLGRFAALKLGIVLFAVAPDPQFQPIRKRVHNRNAHPVQTAGHLIRVAVELTAGV